MRSYGDPCGIARSLDILGERWALLIVRELLLGPKRFTDLRAGLPNVSADVLSQRLRELAAAGVVRQRRLPPPAASQVYELTERGHELEPILLALGRWGAGTPRPPDGELGPDALILALKTLFDPRLAGDLDATYELRLAEHEFTVRVAGGALETRRGAPPSADASIDTDAPTFAAVLWHGRAFADLAVAGDRAAVRRLLELFPQTPGRPT